MAGIKRYCIQTRLPAVEIASCKNESTANLGKEGEVNRLYQSIEDEKVTSCLL